MSTVGAIASTSSRVNGFSSLGSEQFMGIILKELSNQDPLQPSETKDLLEQLSTIRSIQSSADLIGKLDSLVGDNQWAAAGTLIGRDVSGLNDAGTRVTARVVGVARGSDGPIVSLEGGHRLRMSRIDQMVEAAPPES